MATLTSTYAQSDVQAKAVLAGLNWVYAEYTLGAAFSAGDVVQMVKIPNGARIADVKVGNLSVASGSFSVGDGGNTSRYIAGTSATLSTVFSLNQAGGLGYKYSISDDVAVQFDTIDYTQSVAGGSAGSVVRMTVAYTMDETY